ncbi:ABC transporter ATPase [Babesia ovis]|uniref:ABC transporter ATPase n=1 Tax=Babesia ovis TaxID=5869 RepID=A0A9W5T8N0_BABOV|nr:ABC transporter ATPase [Babesia ovis]
MSSPNSLLLAQFVLPLYAFVCVLGLGDISNRNNSACLHSGTYTSLSFITAASRLFFSQNRQDSTAISALADYAMDRKKGLGPNASRRWGRRLDRESRHNFGNVPGNEHIGGCNPEYKFAETYFEDDEVAQWPPMEMRNHTGNLITYIRGKDGGPYGSYKALEGEWKLNNGSSTVIFDRIQSDPFAPPSNIRIRVPKDIHGFPHDVITDKLRNIAACDAINRKICSELKRLAENGKFGIHRNNFMMMEPSQYVLQRKTVVLTEDYLEARMFAHMPGQGRRINGKVAVYMFNEVLPELVRCALEYGSYNAKKFYEHIHCVEDQQALRSQLDKLGLVAFVANGAILPRQSGVSDKPLDGPEVQPFQSPKSLEVSIQVPNRGIITGMGLKRGVSLIVGGGYHGKTTLLEALQTGCYNKIPSDGRQFVVTSPNAVKVRAEDGRSVGAVDISPFIGTLPSGKRCDCFSTSDASGSTSQAAVIMESVEMGADLLLIDEDISATNFMYRDHMMDALVSTSSEPITTFLLLVQAFYNKLGVSTILVSGSCGLFMDQADTVIQMNQYRCLDKTEEAREVIRRHNVDLKQSIQEALNGNRLFETLSVNNRILASETFKRPSDKVRQRGIGSIQYGKDNIDLTYVEQLVEAGQTSAITNILIYLEKIYREQRSAVKDKTIRELLEALYAKWNTATSAIGYNGLDEVNGFKHFPAGDCTMPRIFEVAAALNRMRTLSVAGFKQQQYQTQQT